MTQKQSYELSPEVTARIEAIEAYLDDRIRAGEPIEVLIATRWLGEIAGSRAKEAARVATEGPWSWSDVGEALGMTKQAAHQKLRSRVDDELAKGLSRLDEAEQAGRSKIKRRADRGREGLDRAAPFAQIDSARQRIDEWEQKEHEKLTQKIEKGRKTVAQAQRSVQRKVDRITPPSGD